MDDTSPAGRVARGVLLVIVAGISLAFGWYAGTDALSGCKWGYLMVGMVLGAGAIKGMKEGEG